jgi:hypothetical protein
MQRNSTAQIRTRMDLQRIWLLIFILLMPLMATDVLGAPFPNPAAYLTFDEGIGTVAHDSSGHHNQATLFGAAGWTTGLVGPFALGVPGFTAATCPDSWRRP